MGEVAGYTCPFCFTTRGIKFVRLHTVPAEVDAYGNVVSEDIVGTDLFCTCCGTEWRTTE